MWGELWWFGSQAFKIISLYTTEDWKSKYWRAVPFFKFFKVIFYFLKPVKQSVSLQSLFNKVQGHFYTVRYNCKYVFYCWLQYRNVDPHTLQCWFGSWIRISLRADPVQIHIPGLLWGRNRIKAIQVRAPFCPSESSILNFKYCSFRTLSIIVVKLSSRHWLRDRIRPIVDNETSDSF